MSSSAGAIQGESFAPELFAIEQSDLLLTRKCTYTIGAELEYSKQD